MPFHAENKISIPNKDILSWTFDDVRYDPNEPVSVPEPLARSIHKNTNKIVQIYIDAKDSSRSISAAQAQVLVRKLAAGLEAAGLMKGDCVCIHSFNDVRNYVRIPKPLH